MAGTSEAPTVLIMAAGEGTRMRSSLPKVLHPVCGRPMIAWPVHAAQEAGAGRVLVIVGPTHDLSAGLPEGTETVIQPEANGTGGAMIAAIEAIEASEEVVVLSGDHPLLGVETISELIETHRSEEAAATVMTVEMDDPGTYGRIVRDADGGVERIAETKHPENVPQEILDLGEINTGTYCFHGPSFATALGRITPENEAGELYLGDTLPLLREDGHKIAAYVASDPNVNLGVNTRTDLALVTTEARRKIAERHMLSGVTIVDPASTWIDAEVEIAQDAVIEPGTALRGQTKIGSGSTIGPHTTILSSEVGSESTILRSHLDAARVDDNCTVGPFSYLRPGAHLQNGSKAGAFVEIKNSEIGEGAKVPHLAYVGDTDIGADANLGAGSITANYDGKAKHRTKIGEGARIGVNNSLVAPVEIGEGAYTGAGAVIRSDVPPGSLGVTDAAQRNIEDYAERKSGEADGEK
ncbi:MAG: bifunctional UDP-N-acetylglucosamine diphosphorylase/glucosamine-1-phosphate N-acetyltransferase GlmU [Actinomycetota bacterium]|nr:bifunctional UDP-N-acetylglucosamine diphosphorylase/glucosamine-1-phosphate N-acetyltransferase GlmU [Actinomycetota bacterium]